MWHVIANLRGVPGDAALLAVLEDVEWRSEHGIGSLTRGNITDPTDLNTLRDVSTYGARVARHSMLINGPQQRSTVADPLWTIIVTGGTSSNGKVQLAMSNTEGLAVRYGTFAVDWTDWEYVLTATDLATIQPVVSTDRLAPLAEGQALYVVSEDEAATIWDTNPFTDGNFTFGWNGSVPREDIISYMVTPELAEAGRLKMVTGTVRSMLTWDRFDGTADADVIMTGQIRAAGSGLGFGAAARVAGDYSAGTATAVIAGVSTGSGTRELVLWQFLNGASTIHARTPFPYVNDDQFNVRLQVIGSVARAKAWRSQDREPEAWMIEETVTVTAPGKVGIYPYSSAGTFTGLEVAKL